MWANMTTAVDPSRILVVDDDARTSEALRHLLAAEGYQVRTAEQDSRALTFVSEWRPALVIADVTRIPTHGIELCRRIRVESTTPIIVMSADNSERSKVAALDSGADDYVVKPFAPDELMARVRATLRRAAMVHDSGSLDAGVFRIDFDARRVYVGGRKVRLTPKEFDVFVYLARRPNHVVPHARLLLAVWGPGWSDRREYLRVFMRQLRKKLEENPSRPRHLLTEPWVGYRFNAIVQRNREHAGIEHGKGPRHAESLWRTSEEMVGEAF
jgi:two-component system, OmpR family, KDP operon response regulator KdpE